MSSEVNHGDDDDGDDDAVELEVEGQRGRAACTAWIGTMRITRIDQREQRVPGEEPLVRRGDEDEQRERERRRAGGSSRSRPRRREDERRADDERGQDDRPARPCPGGSGRYSPAATLIG